jgi:ribosomal protein S18 acetylase RimI-like enzyme
MNRLTLRYARPDRVDDAGLLRSFNARVLHYGLRFGRVTTTPDVDAVSVCFGPRRPEFTVPRMLAVGMGAIPAELGVAGFWRLLRLMRFASRAHAAAVTGDHYYLYNLAVDPDRQGQGIGGSLLAPLLAAADDAGVPCYLESRDEASTAFYLKQGFEALGEVCMCEGAPAFTPMVRR